MLEGRAELPEEGVLLPSVQLTQSEQALKEGTDYSISFTGSGKALIERIEGGKITGPTATLKATYDVLDTTAVQEKDIIAGIEKIREVYPRFGIVPGTLIVPGFSGMIRRWQRKTRTTLPTKIAHSFIRW